MKFSNHFTCQKWSLPLSHEPRIWSWNISSPENSPSRWFCCRMTSPQVIFYTCTHWASPCAPLSSGRLRIPETVTSVKRSHAKHHEFFTKNCHSWLEEIMKWIATPKKKCRNVTSEFKNSLRNWTRVPSFWELRRIGWVEVFTRYFEETLHDCSIPSIRGTRPATPSSAGFPNASHHLPWFLVTVNQGVSPHFSGCLHSPLPSLVNIQKAIENGPVEIVDLPSYKIVIFHSFLYVYHSPYPMISPNLIGSMAKTHRWSPGNVPIRRSSVEGSTFLLEPAFFRMRRHRYERWDWLKGKLLRGIDMSWGYIRDTTHKIWLSNSWKT